LIEAQFNSVTAENCLKPDPVQTAEGKFNFTEADALVDFASARHLQIVGHCLVWARDERTPGWFFRDGGLSKVSGTETPARFRMPFSLSVWIHGISRFRPETLQERSVQHDLGDRKVNDQPGHIDERRNERRR
jgi:GH35 family endo-1,4-beta-xylanase